MSFHYLIPFIIMFAAFVLRVPIAFGLMGASIIFFTISGMDIGMVCEKMLSSLYYSYVIIAVPLFIFTANILNDSKVTDTLFTFCKVCIGNCRGALAHVNVLESLIFSGMTGSAFADASGLGLMEIKAMEADGYDREFSCAMSAASATIGPVFPPSITMVQYAMLSGASVGALLLGGMIPGVMLAIVLMGYIVYISKKRNYPRGQKFTLKEFVAFTWKALPVLFTPVILIGGIYSGVVTPTEAGALASFYALIIAMFIYKTMSVKTLFACVKYTALQTGTIVLLICASAPFSYIVTVSGMAQTVAHYFLGISSSPYVFLLFVNVLLLILGMFLDTSTILYVFVPLLLPIATALGVNLVHFGVVVVLNVMIGMCTPPYGMLCFISASLVKGSLKGVFKEVTPMFACMLVVLVLVTCVPWFVTFIPSLMH
jgi:tripartite ATP-independent transporter DctM subunit